VHKNLTIQNLFKLLGRNNIEHRSLVNKKKTVTAVTQLDNGIDQLEEGTVTALDRYIRNIRTMNKKTAHEYYIRLINFQNFVIGRYKTKNGAERKTILDNIITRINEGLEDPYEILNDYISYLQTYHNISALTLKNYVLTIKNFFEYYDVDISPRKFKLKIKLPRVVRKNKEALSKEDIIDILNACSEIRLKTYVMLLAATGMRATEALSIRIKDLDLESQAARLFVRGEYTKTRTDRTVFLTEEIAQQLNSWLDYKYRTRRVSYKDEQTGKTITEIRTPKKIESDLVFAVYQNKKNADSILSIPRSR
jgi:integrase